MRFGGIGSVGLFVLLSACSSAPVTEVEEGGSSGAIAPDLAGPSAESAQVVSARAAALVKIVGADAAQRLMAKQGKIEAVYELKLGKASVTWYEPMEGFEVVAQRGSGSLPLDSDPTADGQTASELFAKLAPGAAVPEELRALDQRVVEMAPIYAKLQAAKGEYPELHTARFASPIADGASPLEANGDEAQRNESAVSVPGGENIAKATSALTSAECVAMKACHSSGTTWTVSQVEVTATRAAPHDDANFATGIGCAISGIITYSGRYRTWFSWTNWWAIDLSGGQFTTTWSRLANLDFDIETTLSNFQNGDKGAQCMNGF